MEKLKFIKEFFKHWREVGSVTPSSRWLLDKIIEPIDFAAALVIVELGPGLGGLTKKVLARMNAESELIVFEINPNFCRELNKINDRRLRVFNLSALAMADQLRDQKVDYVLSGIPLSNLASDSRFRLFQAVKSVLKPDGAYIQFQYSLGVYKKLQSIFDQTSVKFTLLNIPPAFVYQCHIKNI